MILCLDAGNSQLKYGLHDGSAWLLQGAVAYAESQALAHRLPARPARIVACNVAGETARRNIERLAATLGASLTWFSSQIAACGVSNGYLHPERLGADRWAALIGARTLQPGNVLVVLAGTATTIDFLDANGVFRGGLILPGLALMRHSLASGTAGLPLAQGTHHPLPLDTDDAIVSGALEATAGAIERMARHLSADVHGDAAAQQLSCLLSGGAAGALLPHLDLPTRHIEHLVLEGLLCAD